MSRLHGLVFGISILLGLLLVSKAFSQSMRLQDAPLGSVVQIGSFNYVKIAENKYMQSTEITCPDGATVGGKYVKCFTDAQSYKYACIDTLQNFTAEKCASYTTPSGTGYTEIGWFADARDGKLYEVRKFADGVCWMVTNLKYGGTTDACANRTSFNGAGSATPSNRFGVGTYGDCRNNPGSSDYGYLYNWQAAMQAADAYYNTNYTGSATNITGLCPSGWVLPKAYDTSRKGSWAYLHAKAGSPATGFWQPNGSWKGAYGGACGSSGTFGGDQGKSGLYWSSNQFSNTHANDLFFYSTNAEISQNNAYYKSNGRAIRCLHF